MRTSVSRAQLPALIPVEAGGLPAFAGLAGQVNHRPSAKERATSDIAATMQDSGNRTTAAAAAALALSSGIGR